MRTGQGRVFRNAKVTPDVLLASACLPTMFQSVEIDGEAYWDGGYSGNPTITPLVRECRSHDTIIVRSIRWSAPARRALPVTSSTARRGVVNAVLLKELRMIACCARSPIPECEGALWAGMRIHRIASEEMASLEASSKLLAEWASSASCAISAAPPPTDCSPPMRTISASAPAIDLDALLTKV